MGSSLQNQVAQVSPDLMTGRSPKAYGSNPQVCDKINVEAAFSPDCNGTTSYDSSGCLNVARHRKGKHQNKGIKTINQDKSRTSRMVSKYPRNITMSTPFLEYDKGIVFKPVSTGRQLYHRGDSRDWSSEDLRLNGPHSKDTAHPSST